MSATEMLRADHRIIERMINVLELQAQRLLESSDVSPDILARALDFIRGFADRCHHHKEEHLVFPLLMQRGLPQRGGPIQVMLHEHEEGRRLVQQMAEALGRYQAGDQDSRPALAQSILAYAELLRGHIDKEDRVLFPIAEQLLSEQDQNALVEAFDLHEQEDVGEGEHQRYLDLVAELERTTDPAPRGHASAGIR